MIPAVSATSSAAESAAQEGCRCSSTVATVNYGVISTGSFALAHDGCRLILLALNLVGLA